MWPSRYFHQQIVETRACEVSRLNRLSRHILRIFWVLSLSQGLRREHNYLACVESLLEQTVSAQSKFYDQAERAISTGKLHALLRFHIQPINLVVFQGPSFPFWVGRSHLRACFPLICIQRLSQPNFATQLCHWHDSWNTRGSSIPVLSY